MNDDKQNEAIEADCIIKFDGGFSCSKCGLKSKKRYNIKRHLEQKHGKDDICNVDKNLSISVTQNSATLKSRDEISQFLIKLELDQYVKIFNENHIEMNVLLDLRPEEFMDMSKELRINSWAHRHKIKKSLRSV